MFIDFRETGKEKQRNIKVREKHQSVASRMCPDQELNLQPRYVCWPEIEPTTFWCVWWCSNQLSQLARAHHVYFPSLISHQFLTMDTTQTLAQKGP